MVNIGTTLSDIGSGIGALFDGMGPSLAVFIILLAVGAGVGYILQGIATRVTGSVEK